MNMYESELTKFMREFLKQHPEEVESQRKGRAIWWDKRPDERAPVPPMGALAQGRRQRGHLPGSRREREIGVRPDLQRPAEAGQGADAHRRLRHRSIQIKSAEAYDTARYCLMDTLGCGLEALEYPACTKLLGPDRSRRP